MLQENRPWLSIYEGKLSDKPIEGSLTESLEEAVGKYRNNVALTQGEDRITYGELLEKADPKMANMAAPVHLVERQNKARAAVRNVRQV